MGVAKDTRVLTDDFLDWVASQEGRFELVDGAIVEMMAGAKQGHNVVVTNIVSTLTPQAKARGCRTTSSDTAVQTGPNTIRYPDIVVDCGPADPDAIIAENPVLVVEVSSPGTGLVDTSDKLDEYRRHPSIRLILLVEPSLVSVKLYRRDAHGTWHSDKYEGLDETIALSEIGAGLSVSEVYDTLAPRLRPRPQLIESPDDRRSQ